CPYTTLFRSTELLLIVLGGLFVIITLSVIIQVVSFKTTGKRVFRMAPLQHHFELNGWAEVTIVVRFWIIAALFVIAGICLFYAAWVSRAGCEPSRHHTCRYLACRPLRSRNLTCRRHPCSNLTS